MAQAIFERVVGTAMAVPVVRADRSSFLMKELGPIESTARANLLSPVVSVTVFIPASV